MPRRNHAMPWKRTTFSCTPAVLDWHRVSGIGICIGLFRAGYFIANRSIVVDFMDWWNS